MKLKNELNGSVMITVKIIPLSREWGVIFTGKRQGGIFQNDENHLYLGIGVSYIALHM